MSARQTPVMAPGKLLSPTDHNQVLSGFQYVYPVVSRRAGGVSVGVNLNLNNACNWRCRYCQVAGLQRGAPEATDVVQLERELAALLAEILHGNFMQQHVPAAMRQLRDIALAGNGEPTLSKQFPQVIQAVLRQVEAFGLAGKIRLVVITNGSMLHRPAVQAALRELGAAGGEAWVKIDRGSEAGVREVNQVRQTPEQMRSKIERAAACCSVWVQTCMCCLDGAPPDEPAVTDYLNLLASLKGIRGVLLYGLARPPMLEEGRTVSAVTPAWMQQLAARIQAQGIRVERYD
ncbi:radical SAM protein [Paludibacterium sp. THUN1379]|uniref:radical SAM protein n=1 Tax=Paludibacterium sp. THUN1379 TaxID=3112107 RepID=UPI0030CBB8C1